MRTLFEMGVVEGTSGTTFGPDQPVTRAETALAITRMLGHTNARPSGLTIQTENVVVDAESDAEIVISIRDRWHRPVTDAPVDVFEWPIPSSGRTDPFDSRGRCETSRVWATFGADPCEIDQSDDTTGADGNPAHEVPVAEDLTMWAWTGDLRDSFDLDSTDYVSIEFTVVAPPDAFKVTDDMHPEAEKMRYGSSVTFTFQLVDEDGKTVRREDQEIQIRTEETSDGKLARRKTDTYYTDSGGRVTLSYRISSPRYGPRDGDSRLDVIVLESPGLSVTDSTTVGVLSSGVELVWSDEDREATTLVLSQTIPYHTADDSGRGARNRVTGTLLDQYGDPVRGETVHFTSNDTDGLDDDPSDPNKKTIDSRGEATFTYYRDSDIPSTEVITATVEDESGVTVKGVGHYWVASAPSGESTGLLRYHDKPEEHPRLRRVRRSLRDHVPNG